MRVGRANRAQTAYTERMDDPRQQPSVETAPVKIRPEIASAAAYRQGRPAPTGGFKLSSNEVPFAPLPSVVAAIEGAAESINRYPDSSAADLVRRLAALNHVDDDQIAVGPGSISVLRQLVTAVAVPGDEIVYAWRSFEGYPSVVTLNGATSVQVPLTDDGRHDLDAMLDAITDRTRAVLLCSPNNPTGTTLTHDEVERFVASAPRDVLIVIDEAYTEFVRDEDAVNGLAIIADHRNVVTLRTLSKAYGLAGLRVGYAVGDPIVIAAVRASGLPFELTTATIEAAKAALDAREELDERLEILVSRRNQIEAGLVDQGWQVHESQGNFVWLPTGDQTESAAEILEGHGIIARVFPEGIRVTVGERQSIEPLLSATAEIVRGLEN